MELVAQDLSGDALLQKATLAPAGKSQQPSLGGIPLLYKLGDGTIGAIYGARHPEAQRDVTVRVMSAANMEGSERFQRMLADVKAAKAVKSPNLVEIVGGGIENDLFYLVAEFVPGVSAQSHLASLKLRLKPGMTETLGLDVAIAIATGLAAAHEAGVLHLDIRPSNVLIPGEEPRTEVTLDYAGAKLADLGLAYNENTARMLSICAAQTGTPGYMSPEQAMGSQDIGPASDVFSLGATLYTLLVGQPPFGGLSLAAVLSATVNQEAGSVRTWRPDVSRVTARLIEICLDKTPGNRFANAGLLLQGLQICKHAMGGNTDMQNQAISQIESLVQPTDVKQKLLETIFPKAEAAPAEAAADLPVAQEAPPDGGVPTMIGSAPVLPRPPATPPPPAMPVAEEVNAATVVRPQGLRPAGAGSSIMPVLAEVPVPSAPSKENFDDLLKAGAKTDVPNAVPADEIPVPTAAPPVRESPKTVSLSVPPPPSPGGEVEWVDPTTAGAVVGQDDDDARLVGGEENVEQMPARRGGGRMLAAAVVVLALAGGAVAWQMGMLDQWLKPKKTVVAKTPANPPLDPATPPQTPPETTPATTPPDTTPPVTPPDTVATTPPENPPVAVTPPEVKQPDPAPVTPPTPPETVSKPPQTAAEVAAMLVKEEEDRKQKALAEKERLAALEREKAEKEIADFKRKEDERLKVEMAAKAEKDRLAAEARAREDEAKKAEAAKLEQERLAAAKAEQERLAAAKAKAEKEEQDRKRAEEERLLAEKANAEKKRQEEERARAEKDRVAAEARAKLAKEEEERRVAEAKQTHPVSVAPDAELPREVSVDLGGSVTMEFVLVPAGSCMVGTNTAELSQLCAAAGADSKDYKDETPAHRVDLGAYYIARTPVTVAQFRRFVSAKKYQTTAEKVGAAFTLQDRKWQKTPGANWQNPGFEQKDDHPVVMLSYRDCEAFAAWAGEQCGKALRIPTEAEWEYAARGSQNTIYPWGNVWDGRLANHSDKRLKPYCVEDWSYTRSDDGFAFTSPVGAYKNKSWCGALDMAGNVFQWCSDIYEPYPQSSSAPQLIIDPADMDKDAKRVLRGGSYLFRPIDCRAAARRSLKPRTWSCELGMRLAFSAK